MFGIKQVISDYEEKTIEEVLTDLADDDENYYQLLRGGNHSTYELVIRLFSKIPFLQYKFKATSEENSLEDMVNDSLDVMLKKYDDLISEETEDIDKYVDIDEDEITEDFIDSELDRLLGE